MASRIKRTRAVSSFPSAPARRLPRYFWIALALGAFAVMLYARSWRYGFAGDDSFVIVQNAWTQQGLSALPDIVSHSLYFGAVPVNSGLYRPLAGAYYLVVGAIVDLRPAGYHLAQLLLYGLNVATVFLFLRRVAARNVALPLVATVLFAVHPIHTEVVNNIKSADEMLCLQFLLTSAIAWLLYADTAASRWRWISIAAYTLAVCSKETAVPMAIALPALWYFFRGRPLRASLIAAIPFFAIAGVFAVVRYLVLANEPQAAIVTILNNALLATSDRSIQLASALAYLARYVRMLFWPHPLSFDYSHSAIPLHSFGDPVVWIAIALIAGLATLFLWGFRTRRVEAFAVLWFAASMVAVSNVFFLISTNFGERLLYLPSLTACYVVAHLLFKAARIGDAPAVGAALRSPMVVAPLVVVVALGSFASMRRTRDWRDQITLFKADVAKYPNSARLNSYFGSLLYFEGERLLEADTYPDIATEDLANAKAHLERGLSILDTFQEVHASLGMAEYRLQKCNEAIPHLKRAIPFESSREAAIGMLADCYTRLKVAGGALKLFSDLDAEGIEYPRGWFELGNDAAARGDDEASVRYFSRFIAKNPDNVAAHFNLASALHRKGLFAESLRSADNCAELKATPQVAAKCLLLGADDLMRLGRRDEALQHFERAKTLDPNNPWIKK